MNTLYTINKKAKEKSSEKNEVVDTIAKYAGTPYFELLKEFQDLVARAGYDLGQTQVVQHERPLIDEAPIKQRFYRCPDALKDELDKQVNELRDSGMVRPSASPWASPVLLVKKRKRNLSSMC